MTLPWDDTTPLGDVRDWLRRLVVGGAAMSCPCCRRKVKIYQRTLSSGPARVMIAMYRHDEGRDWIYVTKLMNELKDHHKIGGYGTLGHWWGLMEQLPVKRPDGSSRVGWWRLTDIGREWVTEEIPVPQFAYVYNDRLLRLEGPPWMIRQALGTEFDFDRLMRGV